MVDTVGSFTLLACFPVQKGVGSCDLHLLDPFVGGGPDAVVLPNRDVGKGRGGRGDLWERWSGRMSSLAGDQGGGISFLWGSSGPSC